MLKVGLTGGIGSGKSTVADLFSGLGVPVIDTDRLAREVVEPGQPGLVGIVEAFGGGMLRADGRLDRAALREYVFEEPERRRRLEAILHPLIRREMLARVDELDAPYCILVIPLLVESGQTGVVDRVLVVDTSEENQRQRVRRRDGLSEARIDSIMAAQVSRTQRLAHADDVIGNDDGLAPLRRQVERLHRLYLELAAGTHG
jgi:dephospho-CoA kinase